MYGDGVLLRARVTDALEAGRWAGPLAAVLERAHGAVAERAVARPLRLPSVEGRRVPVITVGGATIGGSGRTRVALACVRFLAARARRVALVGHAYRARPGVPRVVDPADDVALVGDEALAAARALAASAEVVVAPTRQAALDFAVARGAEVVVIDGPVTTRPERPALSVLAVDAHAPWGAGHLPPRGDLRAPPAALLAVADRVVEVDAALDPADVAKLQNARFGLFTALARPRRLLQAFARAGLEPAIHVVAPDHGPAPYALRHDVDLWVATPKCAIHLELQAIPALHVLRDAMTLPVAMGQALESCFIRPHALP